MGPTNNLTYLIHHLADVIGKQADQVLREQLGIGFSQYRILLVLDWNPRVQQQVIASSLGQSEASISRQIGLLTERGLLTAQRDPLNKRKHVTVPTPTGMQMTEAASGIIRRNFGPEYAALGDDQLQQMISGLQRLHKIVCKPGKTGACDHQLGF